MRGGRLDLRASVQRAVQTRSRKGELVTAGWVDVAEIWAGEMSMATAERYASQQDIATAECAFLVRAWPGPELFCPEDRFRLVVGGQVYYVRGVARVRGKRGAGGYAVTASTRAEITTPDSPMPAPLERAGAS